MLRVPLFLHGLNGILNQVGQDLLDFNRISKNLGKVLLKE